jgi:hypothetical protein
LPQRLQLFASVNVLVQADPQSVRGAGHVHTPESQVKPGGHALPHPPQFDVVFRRTHAVPHITPV